MRTVGRTLIKMAVEINTHVSLTPFHLFSRMLTAKVCPDRTSSEFLQLEQVVTGDTFKHVAVCAIIKRSGLQSHSETKNLLERRFFDYLLIGGGPAGS